MSATSSVIVLLVYRFCLSSSFVCLALLNLENLCGCVYYLKVVHGIDIFGQLRPDRVRFVEFT